MRSESLAVALISDVFYTPGGPDRLVRRLRDARASGAELAVLPELPLNPWSPATRDPLDSDAEPPEGPRHRALATAARTAAIGLIGGAIVRDPASGARHNTTLIFDRDGSLVAHYCKVHLPQEDGFWETSHYMPGTEQASVIHAFGIPFGVQVCSDINRPIGSHILAAHGAEAIVVPRATEGVTYDRWKLVFRAIALTTSAYVLSVNRPAPEFNVPIGGPSIAVAPDGNVIAESTEAMLIATLDRGIVGATRRNYPGYLPSYPDLYAAGLRAK